MWLWSSPFDRSRNLMFKILAVTDLIRGPVGIALGTVWCWSLWLSTLPVLSCLGSHETWSQLITDTNTLLSSHLVQPHLRQPHVCVVLSQRKSTVLTHTSQEANTAPPSYGKRFWRVSFCSEVMQSTRPCQSAIGHKQINPSHWENHTQPQKGITHTRAHQMCNTLRCWCSKVVR